MSTQANLFDSPKERAIRQVGENAGEAWMQRALAAVKRVATQQPDLTTDDVRGRVPPPPNDPRAWGAVMKEAASRGWVRATYQYRPSEDDTCHNRPKRVWESLIVDAA